MNRNELKHLSFEFFPPKSPRGKTNLLRTADRLEVFKPNFFSVTHGAGGSAREGTLETVRLLRREGHSAVPHITCGSESLDNLAQLLTIYADEGVEELVVLRGDRSPDDTDQPTLRYASDLVGWIREKMGNRFKLNVACYPEMHPEAESISADITNLKTKVDAGADRCVSQYFFNSDAYSSFLASCQAAGIQQPVIPGIMPISNVTKLIEFSNKCGAEIPRWLLKQLQAREGDSDVLRRFAAEVVASLCERLFHDDAPGLHIYTLNLARPTQAVLGRLFVG